MIAVCPPAAVRAMDARAIKNGTPGMELMRRAASALAEKIRQMSNDRSVIFLCGAGNNGGDGLLAAMMVKDLRPRVILLENPAKFRGDAALAYAALEKTLISDKFEPNEHALIVDALFGTGLDREVTGSAAELIRQVNASHARVLSVDIPSGVDGLTGQIRGIAIRADETVTFAVKKPGLLLFPGQKQAGAVTVADIGLPLPADFWQEIEDSDAISRLPRRKTDSHKGTYGHLAVLAGSPGMMGAGALCSAAGLRSGAGLVSWAFLPGMEPRGPWEVMTCPLESGKEAEILGDFLRGKSAAVVGPGLGKDAKSILDGALAAGIPTVVDADGLNALAGHPEDLRGTAGIITPHPGEAARLLSSTIAEISADPVAAAMELAQKTRMVALVKGAVTVISDGEQVAFNHNGNPGMATAGSGDVLSGILGSLLAQGLSPWDAAIAGVHLHGAAGSRAAKEIGMAGMIASDMILQLPKIIRDWVENE